VHPSCRLQARQVKKRWQHTGPPTAVCRGYCWPSGFEISHEPRRGVSTTRTTVVRRQRQGQGRSVGPSLALSLPANTHTHRARGEGKREREREEGGGVRDWGPYGKEERLRGRGSAGIWDGELRLLLPLSPTSRSFQLCPLLIFPPYLP
jgi:hypothetical protein